MKLIDFMIVAIAVAFVLFVVFKQYKSHQQAKKAGKGTPCPSCQVDACGVAHNCVTKEVE